MSKIVLNIDKNIKKNNSPRNISELNSPIITSDGNNENTIDSTLNLSFLESAGNSIKDKRDTEGLAIDTMLMISKEAQTSIFDTTDAIQELSVTLNNSIFIPEAPLVSRFAFKPVTEGLSKNFENIGKDVDSARKSIKTATNSIGKFLDSINPMKNGLGAIKALVQFLLCPEESFIGDILNAIKSVVDVARNIKPKELLENALVELSSHIIGRFPVINNLMNFFNLINRFFDTGGDRKTALDMVSDLIKDLGKKYDYLDNISGLDLIKDLLDPSNNINNGKLPIGSTGLPDEIVAQKCSALGKIIAQLENSYRVGHRLEDIIIDDSLIRQITDKRLRDTVNTLFGVGKKTNEKHKANFNALTLGYHDKTAINSTLSTMITTGAQLNALDAKLAQVNGDPIKYNELALEGLPQLQSLLELNNISLKRMLSMDEGLTNIKRTNDYYDISGILIG